MNYKWVITKEEVQKYLETRLDKKYYRRLRKMSQEEKYKEELDVIRGIYQNTFIRMQEKMDLLVPIMVGYAREFIEAYDAIEAVEEKMDALDNKMENDTSSTCCRGE